MLKISSYLHYLYVKIYFKKGQARCKSNANFSKRSIQVLKV